MGSPVEDSERQRPLRKRDSRREGSPSFWSLSTSEQHRPNSSRPSAAKEEWDDSAAQALSPNYNPPSMSASTSRQMGTHCPVEARDQQGASRGPGREQQGSSWAMAREQQGRASLEGGPWTQEQLPRGDGSKHSITSRGFCPSPGELSPPTDPMLHKNRRAQMEWGGSSSHENGYIHSPTDSPARHRRTHRHRLRKWLGVGKHGSSTAGGTQLARSLALTILFGGLGFVLVSLAFFVFAPRWRLAHAKALLPVSWLTPHHSSSLPLVPTSSLPLPTPSLRGGILIPSALTAESTLQPQSTTGLPARLSALPQAGHVFGYLGLPTIGLGAGRAADHLGTKDLHAGSYRTQLAAGSGASNDATAQRDIGTRVSLLQGEGRETQPARHSKPGGGLQMQGTETQGAVHRKTHGAEEREGSGQAQVHGTEAALGTRIGATTSVRQGSAEPGGTEDGVSASQDRAGRGRGVGAPLQRARGDLRNQGRPQGLFREAHKSGPQQKVLSLSEAVDIVGGPKRSVILATCTINFLDFFENFVVSVEAIGYRERVLVIAEDEEAFALLHAAMPNQTVKGWEIVKSKIQGNASDQGAGLDNTFFNSLLSRRPNYLLAVLELNATLLSADIDNVFLKDPYPHFKGDYDMWVMHDLSWFNRYTTWDPIPAIREQKQNYCTCFLYIIPNERTKGLLRELIATIDRHMRERAGGVFEQTEWNEVMSTSAAGLAVRIGVLSPYLFPTGCIYFGCRPRLQEAYVKQLGDTEWRDIAVVIQNNWLSSHKAKVERFKEHGMWFLTNSTAKLR